MRKVILFIATSLDGFIAGKNNDISWLFTDADYGYAEFYSGIDTILTGRKTFDTTIELGELFSGKTVFVFTRTLNKNYQNINYINSDIPAFIKKLKEQKGKDIWLLGGAEIAGLCQSHNLIDEYVISIHPVTIGEGVPLFTGLNTKSSLICVSAEKFNSGLVQLRYLRNL